MSNVSGIGDAYYWSVFKIAEAFGLHRDTVKGWSVSRTVPNRHPHRNRYPRLLKNKNGRKQ